MRYHRAESPQRKGDEMGRVAPRGYAVEPPVTEPREGTAAARVRVGVERKRATHGELVSLMRTLLRPADGVFTRWSTLRRMLALAGHRTTRTHAIVRALFDVVPDAEMSREGTRRRGPRGVRGVALTCDLAAMRQTVQPRWEKAVGIVPEVPLTPMKFKLNPVNDNGDFDGDNVAVTYERSYANTLATMITRVHLRKADASAYYGIAAEYLHTNGWGHGHSEAGAKAIWTLHCEGATRQEIAKELGFNENKVQSVIDFHRARCGLVHR